jgi:hypothetical protein
MTITATRFEVARDDLSRSRWVETPLAAGDGGVILAVRAFALTANNVTYAVYGEQMKYWSFFPAAEGHGCVPVWGYAEVVEGAIPDLAVGSRVYGYLPMATHLRVEPKKVSAARFVDGAAHRQGLPTVYNTYERVVVGDPTDEAVQMLLRPLVMTSWLIADFLDDEAMFGAKRVIVSSASSKTSLGLGLCLRQLGRAGVTTVGLTSAVNRAFVLGSGAFDAVVSYDDIATLDPAVPTVFVDMAGSADILRRVHHHCGDRLVHSCRVGATHWDVAAGRIDGLPGARPVFFFAPSRIEKRHADWGAGGLVSRFGTVWSGLAAAGRNWLTIEHSAGPSAIEAAWQETLAGRTPPARGLILSP